MFGSTVADPKRAFETSKIRFIKKMVVWENIVKALFRFLMLKTMFKPKLKNETSIQTKL